MGRPGRPFAPTTSPPKCDPCYTAKWQCEEAPHGGDSGESPPISRPGLGKDRIPGKGSFPGGSGGGPRGPDGNPEDPPPPKEGGLPFLQCHWVCEWAGGDPNSTCGDSPPTNENSDWGIEGACLPPVGSPLPMEILCGGISPNPNPECLGYCDPKICDLSPEEADRNADGTFMDERLGAETAKRLPPDCLRATPENFEQKCSRQKQYDLTEIWIMMYGRDQAANLECQKFTGSFFCRDGSVCHVKSNGTFCVQCDEKGNCHQYRASEDGASTCGDRRGCPLPPISEPTPPPTPPPAIDPPKPGDPPKQDPPERDWWPKEPRPERDPSPTSPPPSGSGSGGTGGTLPWAPPPPPPPGLPSRQNNHKRCLRDGTCLSRLQRNPDGASQPPTPQEGNPFGHHADAPEGAGDPVALGSGQLHDGAVDLEIPAQLGTSELHFKLERFYTSGGITQGVLGRNWAHGYEEHLLPITETYPGVESLSPYCTEALPTVRCIAHVSGPGAHEIFIQDPQTLVYLPPPGSYSGLLQRRDEDTQALRGWILRFADGTQTAFDAHGRIRSTRDRHGNTLNFYYGETDSDPLLAVVDPLGRVIRFAYDEQGRLSTVTDFAGRAVTYSYESLIWSDPLPERVRPSLGLSETYPVFTQSRLITVVHSAPETANAAPREATWHYRYLSLDEIRAAIPPGSGLLPSGGEEEICDTVRKTFEIHVGRSLHVDHLIGNLVDVIDPSGQVVLHTTYELDPNSQDFERVVSQE